MLSDRFLSGDIKHLATFFTYCALNETMKSHYGIPGFSISILFGNSKCIFKRFGMERALLSSSIVKCENTLSFNLKR